MWEFAGRLQTPCTRTFIFVLTIFSFYFILFDLKRSHRHMLVGVCWSPINRWATSFVDFGGAARVRPQVPDCLEFVVFCFVCFSHAHKFMRRHLRITRIYFLFLSITDNLYLVLNCLTAGTFYPGAHICLQQLAWPWQTISPWLCCSWPSPSLREPWRALFWSSPRARPFNRTAAWAWLMIYWFWIRNARENDLLWFF